MLNWSGQLGYPIEIIQEVDDVDAALHPDGPSETVFELLLTRIVSGEYAPGARLPAERDLQILLGASRPTIRESVKRLAAWNLVRARRGSGVVVLDRSDWSIEVLPAYLRYLLQSGAVAELRTLVSDLLALRRHLCCDIARLMVGRIPSASIAELRRAIAHADSLRDDPIEFVQADLDVLRTMARVAGFVPGLWLLNRLSQVFVEISRQLVEGLVPPDDYVRCYEAFLDAVDEGRPHEAVDILDDYLGRHDARLLRSWGIES